MIEGPLVLVLDFALKVESSEQQHPWEDQDRQEAATARLVVSFAIQRECHSLRRVNVKEVYGIPHNFYFFITL